LPSAACSSAGVHASEPERSFHSIQRRTGISPRKPQFRSELKKLQGVGLTFEHEDGQQALSASDDWSSALDRYAREHDEYYSALRRILGWMTELTWTPGPEADARRARVFPRMMSDPRGFPDSVGLVPFGPSDDQARRLVLGLD
jgi:hypothetical protein